ncbi:hypothetical protein BSKO_07888 [Bryopsis sp. KO-2023]|nr:hypothetical protein BSKO_07888 [Bryopsis sp. KO-2023]
MIVFDRRLSFNVRIAILLVLAIGAAGQGNRRTLRCLRRRNCGSAAQASTASPTPTLRFSWGDVFPGSGSTEETPPAPPSVILQQPAQTGVVQGTSVTENTAAPTVVYYEPMSTEPVEVSEPEVPLTDEIKPPDTTSGGSSDSTPPPSGKTDGNAGQNDQIDAVKKEEQLGDENEASSEDQGSTPSNRASPDKEAKSRSPLTKKEVVKGRGGLGTGGDETDGAESSSFYDDQVLQSLSQNLQIPRETEAESKVASGCTTIPFEIARYPNLVILSQALEAAGLLKYLDNPKLEVTLFAPTDLAFELMLEKQKLTVKDFLADRKSVREVLSLHIALKPLLTSNLRSSQSVDTRLSGSPILVSASLNDVLVVPPGGDAADVILADIPACRSVVHIVDQVLMPLQDPLGALAG